LTDRWDLKNVKKYCYFNKKWLNKKQVPVTQLVGKAKFSKGKFWQHLEKKLYLLLTSSEV